MRAGAEREVAVGRLADARDDDPILELRSGGRHFYFAATRAPADRRPISRDMVRG